MVQSSDSWLCHFLALALDIANWTFHKLVREKKGLMYGRKAEASTQKDL